MSLKVGERGLLPAVRAAAPDDFVVTNGFSCREQIQQTTGRRVWHLAQVLREALRAGSAEVLTRFPCTPVPVGISM